MLLTIKPIERLTGRLKMINSMLNISMAMAESKETGLETYITWADFSSPIGCFVLRDGA